MSELGRHVEDYLAMRRALGFKLEGAGRMLADFAGYAEQAGVRTVTADVAVAWAGLPRNASPVWAAKRLGVVRVFARYLAAVDPDAEVPSADLLPARARRVTPYLYSDADIAALTAAARMLANPLKAATFETLIGALHSYGARRDRPPVPVAGDSEPVRLDVRDASVPRHRPADLPSPRPPSRCRPRRREAPSAYPRPAPLLRSEDAAPLV